MRHVFAIAALAMTLLAGAPAMADPAAPKLVDGLDGPDFSEQGGLYYRENAEQQAGSVTFQSAVKRTGEGALKLSVKPKCLASEDNCSERAEIWEKTPLRAAYDEPVWYGLAIKLGDPIPTDDHRYLVAQWKREIGPTAKGDFSPFLAIRMKNGKLFITVETNFHPAVTTGADGVMAHCPAGQTPVWLRQKTNQMRAFIAADGDWKPADGGEFNACSDVLTVTSHGNALPGPDSGWIDYAILSRPGADGSGHIEIFANDKWIATVKGHIGHGDPGLGKNQYFKFGPYRAAGAGEWTVFYDDFVRSAQCEDVLADKAACSQIQ
jgi:hypothetical protein